MTGYEQTFYTVVPSALKDIAASLKVIAEAKTNETPANKSVAVEHLPSEEIPANPLKPYWDEERQAVYVPIIDKFVDAKRLTDEEVEWDEGMQLAKDAGKELPSQRDMFALLLFKDEINALISEHGGDILEDWEWSSSEYSASGACYVGFSSGGVYFNLKYNYYYVRAVAA